DREAPTEIAGASGLFADALEQHAPGRIGEGPERAVQGRARTTTASHRQMRNRSVTRMQGVAGAVRLLRENRLGPYPPRVPSPRGQLRTIRDELRQQFLERNDLIDGVLVGLLAGQHVLVIGPPGTAKSMLADEVCRRITGARY